MDALRRCNLGGLKMILNARKVTNDEELLINRKYLMTCHEERVAVLV